MDWLKTTLQIETKQKGMIEITSQIQSVLRDWNVQEGMCFLFLPHTSASLVSSEAREAQLWRRALLRRGPAVFDRALARIGPWSVAALLLTLVLLFAFQGRAILAQPLVIAVLAVPILIQVFGNSALAYWLNRRLGERHSIACPSALIGASNFFELAVAAAISLFGIDSGAALATVVGVLIEVPVMLLVVRVVNCSRGWYERGRAVSP